MRERQPLIEAFEEYDKQSSGGRYRLTNIDSQIADLASVGMYCHVITPTFTDALSHVHRDKLINLDGQLHPLALEWRLAAHFANKLESELAWFEVDQSSPEFVARARGLEWEVECKRVSHMVSELLGDAEADELADHIMRKAISDALCGEITLRVTLDFSRLSAADRIARLQSLMATVQPGSICARDEGFIELTGRLGRASGQRTSADLWYQKVRALQIPGARRYAHASAVEGYAVDPLIVLLAGPQRASLELLDHLWERKFKKAAGQCTGDRGAILVFEWAGIDDANFFKTNAMQALMMRTLKEFRNVATILMTCDPGPTRIAGPMDFSVSAYVARSKVTDFPAVAELAHFS
jgi:hypothetical protein